MWLLFKTVKNNFRSKGFEDSKNNYLVYWLPIKMTGFYFPLKVIEVNGTINLRFESLVVN